MTNALALEVIEVPNSGFMSDQPTNAVIAGTDEVFIIDPGEAARCRSDPAGARAAGRGARQGDCPHTQPPGPRDRRARAQGVVWLPGDAQPKGATRPPPVHGMVGHRCAAHGRHDPHRGRRGVGGNRHAGPFAGPHRPLRAGRAHADRGRPRLRPWHGRHLPAARQDDRILRLAPPMRNASTRARSSPATARS